MGNRLLRGATIGVGFLILVYHLAYFSRETTRTARFTNAGIPRSSMQFVLTGGPPVYETVDTLDYLSFPYPSPGDTIIAIDGTVIDSLPPNTTLASTTPGDTTEITFSHDGSRYSSLLVTRPVEPRLQAFVVAIQVLRFAISLSYLLVGLWAVTRGPRTGGVRALSLFCFAMASMMIASVIMTELGGIEGAFEVPGRQIFTVFLALLSSFSGAFWLNLQILFPRPLTISQNRSIATHLALYILTIIVVAVAVLFGARVAGFTAIFFSAQFVAGIVIIGVRRSRSRTPLERRQLTLVYFGSGLSLGGLLVLGLLSFIQPLRALLPALAQMLVPAALFLLLLISPITFAYALGRYQLLEIEARLRRGTRHTLVAIVVVIVLFLVLYGVSHLLLTVFSVQGREVTVVVALVLALTFAPVHRRAQSLAERQLYPERARLRAILQGFLAGTAVIPDRETFWAQLQRRLRHGLKVEAVMPVLRSDDKGVFELPDGSLTPVADGGALATVLETTVTSLMVDEILVSDRVSLSDGERQWLIENRIGLLLPMIVRSRLIGFLALRFHGESPELHAEDLRILVTLTSQIALRHENLRLLEENVEKKRMEEQLAMARQVQERFLPRELPQTPGLEVAAQCTFSLEVAGDYYDVFPMSNDRTFLAVGDVSGKGAGAAMLMANLRASLRTISGTDLDLAQTVSRLNQLISNDTAADQFITLFVGVFDPSSHMLTYVNAGHNAPRIIRTNGVVETLEAESLVLGVLPHVPYREQSVHLQRGDILLAFTDGVSEAMDANEVEFGESRVVEIVQESKELALDDARAAVRAQVEAHVGGRAFADDFTLLLARALGNTRIEGSSQQ